MTDRDAILLFEQYRPKTIEQIYELGFNPRRIDKGSTRIAYRLTKNLAVKLPTEISDWSIQQSINEIEFLESFETVETIGPELRQELAQHLMPLFYGDKENGVIVTKYYPRGLRPNELIEEHERVRRLFATVNIADMHWNNFCIAESGKLVAIDLGYRFGGIEGATK